MSELAVRYSLQTAVPLSTEIVALWERFGVPDNIRAHSELVCGVALRVREWLVATGLSLAEPVVEAGALLHDVAKKKSIGTSLRHDAEGCRLLTECGYPELGQLVGAHVQPPLDQPLDETLVVYYADKRVKHDRVVDLRDRFGYLKDRYGEGDPEREARIEAGFRRAVQVERNIFERLAPLREPQQLRDVLPHQRWRP